MKKLFWWDLFSEELCKRLLWILLPALAISAYVLACEQKRTERPDMPFRSPYLASSPSLEVFREVYPAVVMIETFHRDGRRKGRATGFFINKEGHLITNHHVIKNASHAKVKTANGEVYDVRGIIAKNPTVDLVKLAVDVKDKYVPVLEFCRELPAWEDTTIVLGHPRGQKLSLSKGTVRAGTADGRISEQCVRFEISAPAAPGSSGGPVLSPDGEVIGVVVGGRVPTSYEYSDSGVTYAIAVAHVEKLKTEDKLIELAQYADNSCSVTRNFRRYPLGLYPCSKRRTQARQMRAPYIR